MSSPYSTIRLEIADRIAVLTLNRPDSRNALNSAMCGELSAAAEALAADDGVHVVVIRAAGPVFCAGADLKERKDMSTAELTARRVKGFTAYAAIERLPQPVIAVVHGPAFGSGCEIAGASDFILASTRARFRYPEVGWGTVGATQRLPRIVGTRMAKELLFTGRTVDAEEARAIGLVNHVYEPGELEDRAMEMARGIAAAAPLTVRLIKRCVDQGVETTREGAMAVELLAIEENPRHSDWKRAIAGFGTQTAAAAPGPRAEASRVETVGAQIAGADAAAGRRPSLLDQPVTLYRVLEDTARRYGAREAFVCQGERLNWSQVRAGTRRLAAALHAQGVRKGDHVGIMLGNGATWLQWFFACATVGAVTVPVNTRFKTDELKFCLKQADVKLLVFADGFLGIDFVELLRAVEPALDRALPGAALPELKRAVMVGDGPCPAGAERYADFLARGEAVDGDGIGRLAAAVGTDDLLPMQFTSGTTSFPKGVMLTHANMLKNAWAAGQRIGVRHDDRYFSIRPFFHVSGTTLSVLVSLVSGCCLLTLPKFDVAETLRVLDRERCTLTSGNDTIFLMMMGHPDFDPKKLHLRGGWAAAGPEVMQQIRDVMGVDHICNAYGQSEASPNVVMSAWDDAFELRAHGWGRPHPGTEVRIVDPASGAVLPPGCQGEIQVRGWHVMRGYYKMPEATARALTPEGWLRTGDLGEMSADGRLRMVGRLKDMYRVGGENVAPAEVEETLHAHPAVQMAQVVGVPDARLGEVTAAFVLLREGRDAGRQELIDWCKGRCANFKVPRYLEIVESFDDIGMTGSSKVQKNKLKAHAIELFGLGSVQPVKMVQP